MASRSSSNHPESSHPYHTDRSHSASSTEPRGRRRNIFTQFLPANLRQGLLPLPEGARLSSSSPPPQLPTITQMPLDLPHPASTPITERMAGDLTWAATYESLPLPPMTILGMPILQHPQPPVSPSKFWNNVTIPLSAYIPAPRNSSPEHRTPPPVSPYTQHRGAPYVWDQPVTTWELALEPVSNEEPVASGSTLPVPNDSSYWSNVIEQRDPLRRTRLHCRRWGHIDRQLTAEPRPPQALLAPPELRYYEYLTDQTSGEDQILPENSYRS